MFLNAFYQTKNFSIDLEEWLLLLFWPRFGHVPSQTKATEAVSHADLYKAGCLEGVLNGMFHTYCEFILWIPMGEEL